MCKLHVYIFGDANRHDHIKWFNDNDVRCLQLFQMSLNLKEVRCVHLKMFNAFYWIFLFVLLLFIFLLKDNCFIEFCCFLSNLNMNQPQVYIHPLPFETPSPSHPSRLIQSPCLSFLSHTANSPWLSILHMVMKVSMLLVPYISPSPPLSPCP